VSDGFFVVSFDNLSIITSESPVPPQPAFVRLLESDPASVYFTTFFWTSIGRLVFITVLNVMGIWCLLVSMDVQIPSIRLPKALEHIDLKDDKTIMLSSDSEEDSDAEGGEYDGDGETETVGNDGTTQSNQKEKPKLRGMALTRDAWRKLTILAPLIWKDADAASRMFMVFAWLTGLVNDGAGLGMTLLIKYIVDMLTGEYDVSGEHRSHGKMQRSH
jgi:hypothetical protein